MNRVIASVAAHPARTYALLVFLGASVCGLFAGVLVTLEKAEGNG